MAYWHSYNIFKGANFQLNCWKNRKFRNYITREINLTIPSSHKMLSTIGIYQQKNTLCKEHILCKCDCVLRIIPHSALASFLYSSLSLLKNCFPISIVLEIHSKICDAFSITFPKIKSRLASLHLTFASIKLSRD